MSTELFEIKAGHEGRGVLIERDAGYINSDDPRNKEAIENLSSQNQDQIKVVDRLRVFAVFQKFGIENANGRIYPEHILKKQVEQYQKLIDDRRSYGELNHPESVTIDGSRLAFGITKLWWEKRTLVGEIELILSPGFVKYGVISCVGDLVANYLRLGWKIGVSSRGLGTVTKDKYTNKHIVQDDFEITCWDIVTTPSTNSAWIGNTINNLNQYVENTNNKDEKKTKLIEGLGDFLLSNNKTLLN